ncbi:MAG: hypothetical protein AABY22_31750, partial [Nanoarchaeota archaeon]
MFYYDVFENRTTALLASYKFFNSSLIDLSSHMIVDVDTGHDVHFIANSKEDTIIIRPSITKCDIYVKDKSGNESCITE